MAVGVPLAAASFSGSREPAQCLMLEPGKGRPLVDVQLHAHQALFGRFLLAAAEEVRLRRDQLNVAKAVTFAGAQELCSSTFCTLPVSSEVIHACLEQVFTVLRGVYLYLLFLPAVVSAPVCMGLGVGREGWLLLMRWTLERAGPVRCLPAL